MSRFVRFILPLAGAMLALGWWMQDVTQASSTRATMLGHMVFFTLTDNSAAAKAKMVESCKKHLSQHEGTVYFSAGTRAEEFDREVNDREWDVALHLVFKDKAAHDRYQDHPRHKQFIEENKANWKKVRVFDSVLGE